jgi:hypothetical protein
VHKLDVPATIDNGTIKDGQENGWVSCNHYVVNLIAFLVVEAQDDELAEVKPAVIVVPEPVVNHPIDRRAEVQLMVKGVKLNLEVDGLGRLFRLVIVEGMSMLMGFHTWFDDRVQIDGGSANIDCYECVRGKLSTRAGSVQ